MRPISRFLPVLLLLLLASCGLESPQKKTESLPPVLPGASGGERPAAKVPAYVLAVLDVVKKTNRAPQDFVGGRTFENRERRLPVHDRQGNDLRYREWDVHAKVPGENRGPERLITGSDSSAWFTKDHYRTFLKIE